MPHWYVDNVLNIVTFLPLFGALALLFADKEKKALIMHAATWIALADFLLSVPLFFLYDADRGGFQFEQRFSWIPSIGVEYYVGIDGISLLLLLLTTFLGFLSILSSWTAVTERVKEYYVFMLLLQTGMLGVFISLDFFLFYIFWEAMLVPMYFLIGIWGGPRKLYAAMKFMLYTIVGSLLMLVAIFYLGYLHYEQFGTPSTSVLDLYRLHIEGGGWLSPQSVLFLAFALSFAIKVPLFPLHTWLPDAHVQAPT